MTVRENFWRAVRPARKRWQRVRQKPPVGHIAWGDFDRDLPINDNWGFERGTPIDRYYITGFLEKNADAIQGHVLEVANNEYTRAFGGDRVSKSEILHPAAGNPRATIIADLAHPEQSTDGLVDCIVCTQTLQLVFEIDAAIESLYRFLKPGGVLLLTVPGISQISGEDMEITGDYWRFTTAALARLLERQFPATSVTVQSHGNVRSSMALLHGVAAEELSRAALDRTDPRYQLLLSARATRPR